LQNCKKQNGIRIKEIGSLSFARYAYQLCGLLFKNCMLKQASGRRRAFLGRLPSCGPWGSATMCPGRTLESAMDFPAKRRATRLTISANGVFRVQIGKNGGFRCCSLPESGNIACIQTGIVRDYRRITGMFVDFFFRLN